MGVNMLQMPKTCIQTKIAAVTGNSRLFPLDSQLSSLLSLEFLPLIWIPPEKFQANQQTEEVLNNNVDFLICFRVSLSFQ